ncbi:MAG: alpha/beta fold hydrolase [Propionibacteriaceae bacterium]|jgi:pimeloyl-ACP methyl ester carboxylesterase
MKASALTALTQLSPAGRTRRERRALRRDPYGLHPTVTEVDGRPIRSLIAGHSRDNSEVVFVAGLGAPGYLAPWARETSRWTRATIVDLPGWRAGHAQACTPTLGAIAMALARWLEATERRDVVLLGHSTGAQAVLKTAQLIPELIRGLVLAGPTFDPDARTMPALLRRAVRTLPHEVPAELPVVLPSYIASGGRPLLQLIRSAMADRPEDQVQQLTTRSVVITGQHDGFAPPAWARHLAELASAPYVILPGAHNGCFPHAQAADTALRSFTDRLASD